MADLYPVVSPLHKREEVEKIIELYSETLQLQCVSEVPTEGVVLVLDRRNRAIYCGSSKN
ncbi:MAG: hypothetical protein HXS46_10790 [Theionarchaea archaeon]|nr:hypothetical protein [Theionarchaea archaeon]